MRKVDPEISLLALLMAIAAAVVFLPLGAVELSADELRLLRLAGSFSSSGIEEPFSASPAGFSSAAYAYLVSVGINVFRLPELIAVRLPSAMVVWMLAVGLFRFCGSNEKKQFAFLAALIFISSYSVSSIAYHATPYALTALALIASLSSLYHWVKGRTRMKSYLLVASVAFSTLFLGIMASAAICAVGCLLLCVQRDRRAGSYVLLAALAAAAAALAYLSVAFLTNCPDTAMRLLGIGELTEPLAEYSRVKMLVLQLVFSIFPWSIPIIVALGWMACNPRWLKSRFLAMSLLKRFGVIVFIIALPFITALNGLSLIMMLTAIYFNAALVSHFLLSQTHNHSVTWRVTGGIFALLTALLACAYICAACGAELPLPGHSLRLPGGFPAGAVVLLAAIAAALYTLWRNQRTIRFNNRYLYNIVLLYILAQMLYKTYINPYLTTVC